MTYEDVEKFRLMSFSLNRIGNFFPCNFTLFSTFEIHTQVKINLYENKSLLQYKKKQTFRNKDKLEYENVEKFFIVTNCKA